MNSSPKIIAVTGAESTGKSSLTKALGKHFNAITIPEFAREYVEKLQHSYTYNDVEVIAKKQVLQLNEALAKNPEYIILDTWLLITKVWFDVVYKKQPDWLEQTIRSTHIDLFLLCETDLPWIADDVRENGGENRISLQKQYLHEIQHYDFAFEKIMGSGNQRTQQAILAIESLI